MRPASEPQIDFAGSNPFLLALLGLKQVAHDISSCLPSHDGLIEPRPSAAATDHAMDLALLGVLGLAQRLEAFAPHDNRVNNSADQASPPAPLDLLR